MKLQWHVTPVGVDRVNDYLDLEQWVWVDSLLPDRAERAKSNIDWGRSWGAENADHKLVGFASSYQMKLPVPGGSLPVGGLSQVGVHPQYRRRGILRALLKTHFQHSLENHEYASLLTASEIPIYTKFGYGQVDRVLKVTLPRGVDLWDVPGQDEIEIELERMDATGFGELTQEIYRQVGKKLARPAWIAPGQDGTWEKHFFEPPQHQDSPEKLRLAIAKRNGKPSGFALFRRTKRWDEGRNPIGHVRIHQVIAADPATTRMLWKTLTDLDLMATCEAGSLRLDDPLFGLLRNPRQAVMTVVDCLHLRLLDLPKALLARNYSHDVDLVLQVRDELFPDNAGCWRLLVTDGNPSVEASDAAPDLSLDIRIMASIYLGGISPMLYADAGLIQEHAPGTVTELTKALWVPRYPGTPFEF
ncbi:MAG: GNAT family N-acetyltransferase [Propionibacteriaceae bacterium]|nr:GNAT family N-acetyltransferase [Propionibacteriaceae bacterium]